MFFSDDFRSLVVSISVLGLLVPCSGQQVPGSISPARVCRRWAHSSVVFSETLYIYGGNARRVQSELGTRNLTINRDFFTLDLSEDFVVADTPFVGLPVPPIPGPAKVLQGSFWVNEAESKFTFYGGSFSPNPQNRTDIVEPLSFWSYHPLTSTWGEEEARGNSVLRASRGASTYYKDIGYYRGGQVDNSTTPNWPGGDAGTVILSGMLKIDLATTTITNETRALGYDVFKFEIPGLQYRDGNLVPLTFNKKDYLINFAGGGQRGNGLPLGDVYVYDIERSSWYRQPTSGGPPKNTRGGCAVANYAPDNSSIQIIFYGGLNYNSVLGDFEAIDSMWILTIPGFEWIPVAPGNKPQGPGTRQDHTCHIRGSQMLLVGGRNDSSICEGSGIWVFDTSKLEWQASYVANSPYAVPTIISSVIGGDSNGGASWDGLPKVAPPDTDSPFFDITGSKASGKKPPSAGVIAGSVIGGLVGIGFISLVIWYFYKRHREQKLDEAPLPPQIEDQGLDPAKTVYGGPPPNEISELGSPVPSSLAPRYSTLSGYNEPAQLHGDSAFPVELYSPPLGHELSSESRGVYEVQSKNTIGSDGDATNEGGSAAYEPLPEAPVPPPVGRN
ncbi:hypothetical protein TWF225_001211 [Orbilia oligospora]|nr:hypothetical protein TWF225_001211 [Orbilia oligospora]KAF3234684.1 hypothetical protein TWF128_002253 [Orbilia oligospora]KAF3269327.1 hypothetical protein TWF217_009412 [Orbilia oligospora]